RLPAALRVLDRPGPPAPVRPDAEPGPQARPFARLPPATSGGHQPRLAAAVHAAAVRAAAVRAAGARGAGQGPGALDATRPGTSGLYRGRRPARAARAVARRARPRGPGTPGRGPCSPGAADRGEGGRRGAGTAAAVHRAR